ncbi:RNA polymerase factor sigma-54 [candidate division WOR-3 bacterium]|nr:RNA polymerase factor sigma-54 [candidate division WOR-3 bacterium]
MINKSSNDRVLEHRFGLYQIQKVTPMQLLQRMLIQIPRLELEHLLYQELESNPMLEFIEDEEVYETQDAKEEVEKEDLLSEELKKFFAEDFSTYFTSTEIREQPESQIPYIPTLTEHLRGELKLETSDPTIIKVGEYIIDSLSKEGFLKIPLEDISEHFEIEIGKAEEILKIIQTFDPPGIGARNLKESIQLQMEREPKKWSLEHKIIEKCWDEYEKKDIDKISIELNINSKKIKKALSNIKNINPLPSSSNYGEIRYVIPSIIINKKGKGFEISINEPNLPSMRLNIKYLNIIKSPKDYDRKTVKFVKDWMNRSLFFLRCLEMRKRNFRSVINYIIDQQKDFLEKGILFMKPLNLFDIAEATNLSESTISRYIKDTYIQTPRGVFHLKYLLSGGIPWKGGKISTNVIREKIKQMIKIESKDTFTDEDIAGILAKEGINISRRTVGKYRKQLGILSSIKRKKENKIYG